MQNLSLKISEEPALGNRQSPPVEDMNIVITGHVDHGKSTIIGRLLADTGSLPQGKLELVREFCRRNAKPFEYAFLLDALKNERAQGITIDAARCFFKTAKRRYIIIDAPGHIEFLKNMVTGASRAEAALLVIDATEGVRENSRRHGYMLRMLGIRQVAVLINKMDLVNYAAAAFQDIVSAYGEYLKQIAIRPTAFIPVSGMAGDNIAAASARLNWYTGPTVLAALDGFVTEKPPRDKPFRLPVQGVYKFTRGGDNRRIVAGTIQSGVLRVGDEVIFYPAGKKSRVATLETFNGKPGAEAGWATGFTLAEQIYVKRGDIAALTHETQPRVGSRIKVNLFWLGREPLVPQKKFCLKLGSDRVDAKIETMIRVSDAASLKPLLKNEVGRHEVAECILQLERMIAFDPAGELAQTGRFVIVANYEIAGGGIILGAMDDRQNKTRVQVTVPDYQWKKSGLSPTERVKRFKQKPVLLLITGPRAADKHAVAAALERELFNEGRLVYFFGSADPYYEEEIDCENNNRDCREDRFRRLAETARLMLDAGLILITVVGELTGDDLALLKMVVAEEMIKTVRIGGRITAASAVDWIVPEADSTRQAVAALKEFLREGRILLKR